MSGQDEMAFAEALNEELGLKKPDESVPDTWMSSEELEPLDQEDESVFPSSGLVEERPVRVPENTYLAQLAGTQDIPDRFPPALQTSGQGEDMATVDLPQEMVDYAAQQVDKVAQTNPSYPKVKAVPEPPKPPLKASWVVGDRAVISGLKQAPTYLQHFDGTEVQILRIAGSHAEVKAPGCKLTVPVQLLKPVGSVPVIPKAQVTVVRDDRAQRARNRIVAALSGPNRALDMLGGVWVQTERSGDRFLIDARTLEALVSAAEMLRDIEFSLLRRI